MEHGAVNGGGLSLCSSPRCKARRAVSSSVCVISRKAKVMNSLHYQMTACFNLIDEDEEEEHHLDQQRHALSCF